MQKDTWQNDELSQFLLNFVAPSFSSFPEEITNFEHVKGASTTTLYLNDLDKQHGK